MRMIQGMLIGLCCISMGDAASEPIGGGGEGPVTPEPTPEQAPDTSIEEDDTEADEADEEDEDESETEADDS